ncbi:MAG: translocation/assembly module TamB domain-containing protein [Candidatus Edwardsbacteria bacterium]
MKLKKTLKVIGLVALIFILLFIILINLPFVWTKIRKVAVQQLSQMINGEFTLEKIDGNLFTGLAFHKIKITQEDKNFAEISKLTISFNLLRLIWERKLVIHRIRIESPKIFIEKDSVGNWNFSKIIKSQPKETKIKPEKKVRLLPFEAEYVTLNNGWLQVKQPQRTDIIKNLKFEVSLKIRNEKIEIRLKDFGAEYPQKNFVLKKIVGHFVLGQDEITLQNFVWQSQNSRLEASARFSPTDSTFDFALPKFDLSLSEIANLFLMNPVRNSKEPGFMGVSNGMNGKEWSGQLQVSGHLYGKWNSPSGQMKFQLAKSTVAGYEIKNTKGEVCLEKGRLNLPLFSGEMAGTKIEIETSSFVDLIERNFSFQVNFREADLKRLIPSLSDNFQSEISGSIKINGCKFATKQMQAEAELTLNQGHIGEFNFESLEGNFSLDPEHLEVTSLKLQSGESYLKAEGDIYREAININLETNEIDIARLGPLIGIRGLTGHLRLTGLIGGEPKNPSIVGTFRLKDGSLANVTFKFFDGNLSMKQIRTKPQGEGRFTGFDLTLLGQPFEFVDFRVELTEEKGGIFSLSIKKDEENQGIITGEIAIDKTGVNAHLEKFYATVKGEEILNSRPLDLAWKNGNLIVEGIRLLIARGEVRLEGQTDFNKTLSGNLHLKGIDLRSVFSLLSLNYQTHGFVDLKGSFEGSFDNPRLKINLKIRSPSFEMVDANQLRGEITYQDKILKVNYIELMRAGEKSEITGTFPLDLSFKPVANRILKDSPLEAEIILRNTGTWLFFPLADLLSATEGRIDVNLKASGTFSEPHLDGELVLHSGTMILRPFGALIRSMEGDIRLTEDGVFFEQFTGLTEGGNFKIRKGEIRFVRFQPKEMKLVLHIENTPVHNLDYMEGRVTADITIGGLINRPKIEGKIEVLSALVTLPFGGEVEPPPPPPPGAVPLEIDLFIRGTKNIWLRNKDADVELKINELRVRQENNVLVLSGNLETMRGTYRYFDRNFEITSGKLVFTNIPEINPELDFYAQTTVYREDKSSPGQKIPVTIFLHLSGTALKPQLTFSSSEKGLSEENILTLLTLNVPWDQLVEFGKKDLTGQLNRGIDYLTDMFARTIREKTGLLDEIKIKTSLQGGGRESARITVGKYVTKNVFVSYSHDLLPNPENVDAIRATYFLGRTQSLFGERDEEGKFNLGIRLRYRF